MSAGSRRQAIDQVIGTDVDLRPNTVTHTLNREAAMADPYLKGQWNELKGRVKERWGELTNDDLDRIEGRRDQLVGAIQQQYGRARDEVEREVERWEKEQGLR
jgi:uncharacterized protein YjbJ (UPF0337 family)